MALKVYARILNMNMKKRNSMKTFCLVAALIFIMFVIAAHHHQPSRRIIKEILHKHVYLEQATKSPILRSPVLEQSEATHKEVIVNNPTTSLNITTKNERDTKPIISQVLESRIPETIHEHIHLRNVAFDSKNVHIYSPSPQLRKSFEKMTTLPVYKRFSGGKFLSDLPTPRIVFHDEPLNTTQTCDQGAVRQEHAFFFTPWHTDNMFHLHNDNILPLMDNVLQMPGCGVATLHCDLPKVLYEFAGDPARLQREVQAVKILRRYMFDDVKRWQDVFSKDKPVCIASVSWGRGPHFFYVGNLPWYTNGKQSHIYPLKVWTQIPEPKVFGGVIKDRATAALRSIRSLLNLDRRNDTDYTKTVRAIYIGRSTSDTRRVQNPEVIMEVCSEMGWQCDTCCDWKGNTFEEIAQLMSRADVVMGAHGAGLTHVMYARPGASLIDFGAPGAWKGQFTSMVMTNGDGTYIRVPTAKWPMVVSKEQVRNAFQNAKQLWEKRRFTKQTESGRVVNDA